MRIGTNTIGNYSPVYKKTAVTNVVNTKQVEAKPAISKSEKAFFSNLYPENKEKIMDHHFYMKNGNMSGVTVGSLFDRRG